MSKHIANTLLMIEPVAFGFNEQTALNNYFQSHEGASDAQNIQKLALTEFKNLENALRNKDINLFVVTDSVDPHTPDSIFPNNWISFHRDGHVAVYPMYAENRRLERRAEILHQLVKDKFVVMDIVDYSAAEKENRFLEGTGSMVLDREHKIAYAALSERTDKNLFEKFCKDFKYKPISFNTFHTVNGERKPIYHTNVMMCVASGYTVICLEAIDNPKERDLVTESLRSTRKEIIEISEDQMNHFAGNMLQVQNFKTERFLVMSQSAYNSLGKEQIAAIEKYNPIISVDIPTIEKYGGGSVRCMLAEIFIPRN